MPTDRPERRLRDILENIRRIEAHVSGMSKATFEHDLLRQDAVERCLQRISEALYKLGDQFDSTYPNVDLKGFRALGNILRHQYDDVDVVLLWGTVDPERGELKDLRNFAEAELAKRIGGDGA